MYLSDSISPAAVVLAAGASRRMGRPKAFLETRDGGTFLGEILSAAQLFALSPIVIVTSRELESAIRSAAPGAVVLVNPDPRRGQFSSLQTALGHGVLGENSGFLTFTVDSPGKLAERTGSLLEGIRKNPCSIIQPAYLGAPGHPVWLPRESFAALGQWRGPEGLRGFIASGTFPVRLLEIPYRECLTDVDTLARHHEYLKD